MFEQENRRPYRRSVPRRRISEQLAVSRWVWRLAQLGYAAKGLLYVIIGGTTALAAMHVGGRVIGMRGALNLLVTRPFGRLAVALVAVGLIGFILRRFVQIFVPPTKGMRPRPITWVLRRAGYALSGLGHIGIVLTALQLVLGLVVARPSGQTAARDWLARLLVWNPIDGWLPLLAGLAVLGVAIVHFYLAVSRRFRVDLTLDRMSERMKRVAFACGIAGHTALGVAFLIVGLFLVYAGWFVEEVEARRVSDVLSRLEAQPFGAWLLIAIAAGLAAYGLYLMLAAWYLRLVATW
jgi:hypothetical protein